MDIINEIISKLSKLSPQKQGEVFNFINTISAQNSDVQLPNEELDWSKFSLDQALKDLETEPDLYSLDDINT